MIPLSLRSITATIAAVLAVLCAPAAASAQSTGEVAGSISDQTGAPLPGVRMTIRGVADREAETSTAGEFVFGDLPEGDVRDFGGAERIRASAPFCAREGGRTCHRVPHLAGRHCGRNVRHGREGGRTRRSDDSHGDQCDLRLRSSRAWARRHCLMPLPSHLRSRSLRTPVSANSPSEESGRMS